LSLSATNISEDIFKIMGMELKIRNTVRQEYYQTENLTREAFWNLYRSGCDEHLVLHQIRERSCYIEKLDKIAIYKEEIVGHIISSIAKVIDKQNKEHKVLCVGPVSVAPSFQNQGIGAQLMNSSISEAQKMGFKAMILFGNPDYYHRFGFVNAKEFDITTKDSQNLEPFMAFELQKNGLKDVEGRFFEDDAFTIQEEQLTEYEKRFPHKEKGEARVDISQFK
jgi:predicted N-acetyltransferase YhbS